MSDSVSRSRRIGLMRLAAGFAVLIIFGVTYAYLNPPPDAKTLARRQHEERLQYQRDHRTEIAAEAKAAHDARVASDAELDDLMSISRTLNPASRRTYGAALVHELGVSGDGKTLFVTVDGDTWDLMHDQERTLMKRLYLKGFAMEYQRHHHDPDASVAIVIRNLAGDELADDY